jgi:hypothetical protein
MVIFLFWSRIYLYSIINLWFWKFKSCIGIGAFLRHTQFEAIPSISNTIGNQLDSLWCALQIWQLKTNRTLSDLGYPYTWPARRWIPKWLRGEIEHQSFFNNQSTSHRDATMATPPAAPIHPPHHNTNAQNHTTMAHAAAALHRHPVSHPRSLSPLLQLLQSPPPPSTTLGQNHSSNSFGEKERYSSTGWRCDWTIQLLYLNWRFIQSSIISVAKGPLFDDILLLLGIKVRFHVENVLPCPVDWCHDVESKGEFARHLLHIKLSALKLFVFA